MSDLATNLDYFETIDLELTRFEPSILNVEGIYEEQAASVVLLQGVVIVPLTGRQLELLPEGWRTREPIQVFAREAVRTLDETTKTAADRFTHDGKTFEVQQVYDWSTLGGFWVAVAVKVEAA